MTRTSPWKELPSTILANITERLSPTELCIFLRVCSSWNAALTPLQYHSIDLISSNQMTKFIKTIANSHAYKPLGHFVRRLSTHRLKITKAELALFLKHCPYVVELAVTIQKDFNFLPFLHRWKYLTKVSVQIDGETCYLFPTAYLYQRLISLSLCSLRLAEWIDDIATLVSIEELKLQCPERKWKDTDGIITFIDLEKLHNHLPRLRLFAIHNFQIHGELPVSIVPCETVRDLSLIIGNSRQWGHYFGTKYKELTTLKVCTAKNKNNMHLHTEMMPLVKVCHRLKELTMTDQEAYRSFLEAIQSLGAPLTNLCHKGENTLWLSKMLCGFQRTISRLKMDSCLRLSVDTLLRALEDLPFLEDLELRYEESDLELNQVLEKLNHLKILTIRTRRIGMSSHSNHIRRQTYPLRHLSMYADDIENGVYLYLALSCFRLSVLDCTYLCSWNRSCIIYYPHPGLQRLTVDYKDNCIFKLIRTDEILSRPGIRSLERKREIKASMQCYYNRNGIMQRLAGLHFSDIDHIFHLLENSLNMEERIIAKTTKEPRVVSIQCHYVGFILLNGMKAIV
ncbi:hypothetical protein EC973_006831 [Apophysomyces ossiformis]|uniref:F-box domain-containing protein n=1 Tax=Apophysomyces ossiformis TaxID=679940 RepID=A0A8H7BUX6_9FUNG|nr:hypothetical protein EC973_006831 [Apophysomyces ossiformis]